MVDTALETWDVVLLSDDILVNTCWPFWSTNPPWSAVKIWENGHFGHISCCTTGNIGQHVLTKVVLTKSMMHQLSKTVSNVSQLFLDHFITFCKETTYFQAKVVLKIGRCQVFRWFSQPWGRVVSYQFRRPKGIISAPKTPNIQQVTHLPSYPLRGIYNPYRISKTEFFTRFAELVNTGQHLLTKNIFVEK